MSAKWETEIQNNYIIKKCALTLNYRTFHLHSLREALVESAAWASLPAALVYCALLVSRALVLLLVLDCTLEEALEKIKISNKAFCTI